MFYEEKITPALPIKIIKLDKQKEIEELDTFDDFKYNEEVLNVTKDFLTKQYINLKLYRNPWLNYESLAVYLSNTKSIFIGIEDEKEESIVKN